MKYEIVNVVVSGSIADRVNLTDLFSFLTEQLKLPVGKRSLKELNDVICCNKYRIFPGLSLKFKNPSNSVLIFSTGRIIISGNKSFDDAKVTVNKLVNILRYLKINVYSKPVLKVNNMVAYVEISKTLNINKIVDTLMKSGVEFEYEPEQFPSLIYGSLRLKAVICRNGKIIILGARNEDEIKEMINKIKKLVGGD